MTTTPDWTIPGSNAEPIIGNCHRPEGEAAGVILLAHGFKGYKDYGMFPPLAEAMAAAGLIAHRYNFSHSGMTDRIETFERPDLFERDTWNRQVGDETKVIEAVAAGTLAGGGLPMILFGHSRGGATVLLTAGRTADDPSFPAPAGVIAASAPSRCDMMPEEQMRELLERGHLESPSSRTGQLLRVGRVFLDEQRADPEGHDLVALAGRIRCPVLLVHGRDDATVPCACAEELGRAAGDSGDVRIIDGCDHVFGTPNPMPSGAEASPALAALIEAMKVFAARVLTAVAARGSGG